MRENHNELPKGALQFYGEIKREAANEDKVFVAKDVCPDIMISKNSDTHENFRVVIHVSIRASDQNTVLVHRHKGLRAVSAYGDTLIAYSAPQHGFELAHAMMASIVRKQTPPSLLANMPKSQLQVIGAVFDHEEMLAHLYFGILLPFAGVVGNNLVEISEAISDMSMLDLPHDDVFIKRGFLKGVSDFGV